MPGPDSVGEPLVGGVADQAVAEPDPVVTVGLEEGRERGERLWRRGQSPSAVEVALEHLAPEAAAEHGAVAQDPARGGGSWSIWVLIAACTDSGSCSSDPEPRASRVTSSTKSGLPLGALDDGGDLVGAQGGRLRRGDDELLDDLGGQRGQHHARSRLRDEATRVTSPYDDDRPRPAGRRGRDPASRCGRGAVGPVGLLDHEDERPAHQPREEVDDDVGRPGRRGTAGRSGRPQAWPVRPPGRRRPAAAPSAAVPARDASRAAQQRRPHALRRVARDAQQLRAAGRAARGRCSTHRTARRARPAGGARRGDAASSRASCASRDLPIPVAPSTVTTPPTPLSASSSARRTVAVSSSRPRKGRRESSTPSRVPISSPTA